MGEATAQGSFGDSGSEEPAPRAAGRGGLRRVALRITTVAIAMTLADAGSDDRVEAAPRLAGGDLQCSHCHDAPPRSELRYHEEEQERLVRVRSPPWCFDCHYPAGGPTLGSSSGDPGPFTEYAECARCHFRKRIDRPVDIHGTEAGCSEVTNIRPHCGSCHDPQASADAST